jgi:dihydropteroate synthase
VLDVGGESTRPGAEPVAADVELARVVPVIEQIARATSTTISVDTTKPAVARAALEAGATVVNDVSGGDDEMLAVVAEHDAGFVAMHMRGTPRTMQDDPTYEDVVTEVAAYLRTRVLAAAAAGVRRDAILVDPGIGFGKTADHNLTLLRALPVIAATSGAPVVVGTSRKSFLGRATGGLPVGERDEATLATSVWCFEQGAAMVRVHDVDASARAALLLDVMERATPDGVVAA